MAFAAGSIAFVAYSFDNFNAGLGNQQGFAFVALEPIAHQWLTEGAEAESRRLKRKVTKKEYLTALLKRSHLQRRRLVASTSGEASRIIRDA